MRLQMLCVLVSVTACQLVASQSTTSTAWLASSTTAASFVTATPPSTRMPADSDIVDFPIEASLAPTNDAARRQSVWQDRRLWFVAAGGGFVIIAATIVAVGITQQGRKRRNLALDLEWCDPDSVPDSLLRPPSGVSSSLTSAPPSTIGTSISTTPSFDVLWMLEAPRARQHGVPAVALSKVKQLRKLSNYRLSAMDMSNFDTDHLGQIHAYDVVLTEVLEEDEENETGAEADGELICPVPAPPSPARDGCRLPSNGPSCDSSIDDCELTSLRLPMPDPRSPVEQAGSPINLRAPSCAPSNASTAAASHVAHDLFNGRNASAASTWAMSRSTDGTQTL